MAAAEAKGVTSNFVCVNEGEKANPSMMWLSLFLFLRDEQKESSQRS